MYIIYTYVHTYIYNKSARSSRKKKKEKEKEIKIKSKINKRRLATYSYYSYYIILFCSIPVLDDVATPGTWLLLTVPCNKITTEKVNIIFYS